MEHIKIIQNNTLADTEEVSNEIIQKLYDLAISGDLDASSEMKGRLHLTQGYRTQMEYLHQMFPNLVITADDYIIPFEDANMLTYLNSIGVGSNGMVTEAQAAAATVVANSQNTEVTKFNELKYFTSITESNGGWDGAGQGVCRFYGWTALEEVDISNFTSIGHKDVFAPNDSFYGCTNLKKVTASNKLTKFGRCAFQQCSNLEDIIGLSGTIILEDAVFNMCTKLKSTSFDNCDIIFYSSKGAGAFKSCNTLTSITLNDSVSVLQENCFKDCSALASINLNNITEFKHSCFNGCTALSITSAGLSPNITTVGNYAFEKCPLLTSFNFANVTSIGYGAFSRTGLTGNIDLSNLTDTTLMQSVFYNCSNLNQVTLPSTITSIKWSAFEGCTSLSNINLNNISYIENNAFKNTALTSVDLTGASTLTGEGIFLNCSQLTTVTLSSALTTLPKTMFYSCSSLTSINLNNVTTFKNQALQNCTNLQLTQSSLSPNIVEIADGAFQQLTNTTGSFSFSNLTTIGRAAFSQSGFYSIDFTGSTFTSCPQSVFRQCSNLHDVTFPDTCNNFDSTVFYYNLNLQKVVIPYSGQVTIASDTFSAFQQNGASIYVDDDYVDVYRANSLWISQVPANNIKPISSL